MIQPRWLHLLLVNEDNGGWQAVDGMVGRGGVHRVDTGIDGVGREYCSLFGP